MLRVREVAARLGVHPVTVYRWINSGRLPAVRYGQSASATKGTGRGGALTVPESVLVNFDQAPPAGS